MIEFIILLMGLLFLFFCGCTFITHEDTFINVACGIATIVVGFSIYFLIQLNINKNNTRDYLIIESVTQNEKGNSYTIKT